MRKYYREPAGETIPQLEEEILRAWRAQGLLQKVKERMRSGEPLVFCEGPPTANSRPNIGHALTRAVKDSFLRYHIMNGRKVLPYIAGWDCHGLPVEVEVERSSGLRCKKDIEEMGIAEFNDLCRENIMRYKADWERMSERVGYMIDYEHAYLTMSNEYIESVWWSLKQLHSKGMLQKSHQVLPYCPRCGTTLSTHEVALGYRESEDRYVIVRFPVKGMDASLLVYTESPWTLGANALLAVDKDQEYVVVSQAGEILIMSAARKEAVIPGGRELMRLKGVDLLGKEYEPPFRHALLGGRGYRIVDMPGLAGDEGSGVTSISPPYGSGDYALGISNGLEMFDPVDDSGRFTSAVPGLEGISARESDSEMMRILEAKGLLFKWGLVKHISPFCYRCDSALIYKPKESWFVRASEAKKRMMELNERIRWMPSSFKHGRFGSFVADAKDWAISRSRYWGTPIPVWRCAQGHEVCVGSISELKDLASGELPEDLDLHRPSVDGVILACPECKGEMHREEFVMDFWYDSGCAAFAQYHYPFENMEAFEKHKSVDFISESDDQTRGWFYSQHVISTLLFDEPAFMSVLVVKGHMLDDKGRRMSSSAGNMVYLDDVFPAVGADAFRLYLLGNPVWQPLQFSEENVRKTMVSTINTLLNVYTFYASNANTYGYTGQAGQERTHDLDVWIISRLNSTARSARAGFEGLEVHKAVRAIGAFIEDLSNWYVRRSRRRFWETNDPQDRFSAHFTLNECLTKLAQLMAPITPFFADWLYRNMHGPKGSVHLEDYPTVDEDSINGPLEDQMSFLRKAVEAGRLARQKVNIKMRQPLEEAVIAAGRDGTWVLRKYEKMLAEELNVKKVECIETRDKMVEFAVTPNLKTLGPRLKEAAAEVTRLMEKIDGHELAKHLKGKGKVRLGGFDLYEDDVIISEREKAGYSHAGVGDVHVYVALELNQKLKLEGLSREIVRRIQHMRKEQGFEFEDLIDVEYSAHQDIETAFSVYRAFIAHETHARSLTKKQSPEGAFRWMVNKMPLELAIRKAKS